MLRSLDVATSLTASVLRLGAGRRVRGVGKRPAKLLELYEFEACPYCRRAREALTTFDLRAMIHPCPKSGRHRATVLAQGGKEQFPFLVDPNTATRMYESADIVAYLAATYGDGHAPLSLGPLAVVSGGLASAVRARGGRVRRARAAENPLALYSYESSPYCRIVRERLCELELDYELVNVGKGSAERDAFVKKSGKMMVPYLEDPNTRVAMFESADITAYLEEEYAVA